jgi:hypothetical protein
MHMAISPRRNPATFKINITMAKQYFKLTGYYEGLTAKRVAQSGRLWLVRIVNDPPPYWFVMIKNFDLTRDKASGAKSMGVWRFTGEADALAKFNELRPLYPSYVPSEKQLAARARFKELKARALCATL